MTDAGACPCCGQRLPGPLTVAELRTWLEGRGYPVLAGDLVPTEAAAAVLGLEAQSLRADRMNGAAVPFVKRGRRCYYRLADLADVDLR
jgi:hypothetical protein